MERSSCRYFAHHCIQVTFSLPHLGKRGFRFSIAETLCQLVNPNPLHRPPPPHCMSVLTCATMSLCTAPQHQLVHLIPTTLHLNSNLSTCSPLYCTSVSTCAPVLPLFTVSVTEPKLFVLAPTPTFKKFPEPAPALT